MPANDQDFEALLEPHYPAAYAYAVHLCRNAAEGADLLHDALCVAFERFDGLREKDRFKPWLLRIIGNRAHNRRRHARLFARVELALGLTSTVSAHGDHQAAERQAVQKILDTLPRVQREALVMAELAGETLETVAQVQNVPLGTAKSRLREAKRRFIERWQELDAVGEAPLPVVVPEVKP